MSSTKKKKQTFCAICAHDIETPACPHPWSMAFEEWPAPLLSKVMDILTSDPSPGS